MIEEMVVTDTIMPVRSFKNKKITIVSVAPLVAEAIRRIKTGESISKSTDFIIPQRSLYSIINL